LVINRAKCHEELGEFEAARELFTLAFDTFHDAPSTIEWINFLLRRERSGDALAAIETALPFMDDETGVVLLGTSAAVHLRAGHTAHAQRCVDRAVERGDRAAASASIEVLAEQLRLPELAALLPAPVRARAAGLSIAYVAQR
jgi:hypothetical protein